MREIKFRAWDKNRNLMCTSDIAGHWKTDYLLDLEMTVWDTSKGLSFDGIVEDTFEFMQYTGLKDKNGKEIYEGDIIEWVNWSNNESKLITIIEYENDYAAFFLGNWYERSFPETSEEALIIGNIYENPELLTKD